MPANTEFDFPGINVKQGSLAKVAEVQLKAYTFASLPASPTVGTIAYITDSNTVTWGATIAGSSTHKVLGWYNGTNWTVIGI